MDIKQALSKLDSMDDSHWTSDGAPAVEAVSNILGKKVTRAEIISAAPKFTRENMELDIETEEKSEEEKTDENTEVDVSILKNFSEEEPMLPQELVDKYLKKMDPRLLPELENLLTQQIGVIELKEKELEEMKRKVKLCKATVTTWIKKLVPDMSNQEAIQAYIRASQENRMKKVMQIKQVLGGLNPSDLAKLDPRSAIDKAFARKTGRGGQRPVR